MLLFKHDQPDFKQELGAAGGITGIEEEEELQVGEGLRLGGVSMYFYVC